MVLKLRGAYPKCQFTSAPLDGVAITGKGCSIHKVLQALNAWHIVLPSTTQWKSIAPSIAADFAKQGQVTSFNHLRLLRFAPTPLNH